MAPIKGTSFVTIARVSNMFVFTFEVKRVFCELGNIRINDSICSVDRTNNIVFGNKAKYPNGVLQRPGTLINN